MRILSVNIGRPTRIEAAGAIVTGIDKRPVAGAVPVSAPGPSGIAGSGLTGDAVCDRRHHGGNDQAVYAYAREDLDQWSTALGRDLSDGSFGENLTTIGIDISNAVIGEMWSVGNELVLQISDPRLPCRTFAGFLGEPDWINRFIARAAPGTYFRVLTPGAVRAGDAVRIVKRPAHGVTVATAFRAFTTAPELLPDLLQVAELSAGARSVVTRRVPASPGIAD